MHTAPRRVASRRCSPRARQQAILISPDFAIIATLSTPIAAGFERGLAIGFFRYLTKPIDELLETLDAAMRSTTLATAHADKGHRT